MEGREWVGLEREGGERKVVLIGSVAAGYFHDSAGCCVGVVCLWACRRLPVGDRERAGIMGEGGVSLLATPRPP